MEVKEGWVGMMREGLGLLFFRVLVFCSSVLGGIFFVIVMVRWRIFRFLVSLVCF